MQAQPKNATLIVADMVAMLEAVENWLKSPMTIFDEAECCVWDMVCDLEAPSYRYESTLSLEVEGEGSIKQFTLSVSRQNFCSPAAKDTIVRTNDDLVTTHYLSIKLYALVRHAEAFRVSGVDSSLAGLMGTAALMLNVPNGIVMPCVTKAETTDITTRRVVMWTWQPLLEHLQGQHPCIEFVK